MPLRQTTCLPGQWLDGHQMACSAGLACGPAASNEAARACKTLQWRIAASLHTARPVDCACMQTFHMLGIWGQACKMCSFCVWPACQRALADLEEDTCLAALISACARHHHSPRCTADAIQCMSTADKHNNCVLMRTGALTAERRIQAAVASTTEQAHQPPSVQHRLSCLGLTRG